MYCNVTLRLIFQNRITYYVGKHHMIIRHRNSQKILDTKVSDIPVSASTSIIHAPLSIGFLLNLQLFIYYYVCRASLFILFYPRLVVECFIFLESIESVFRNYTQSCYHTCILQVCFQIKSLRSYILNF